jgi:hypothetical protein
MKKLLYILPLTIAFLATNPAKAQIVFSDNFSSGLGNWNPNGQGVVVSDATYGQALSFTVLAYGSGVMTTTFNAQPGEWINFAYEGVGGFLAVGNQWLAGLTTAYDDANQINLPNSQTWTSYSVYDQSYTGVLNIEDYGGVSGSGPLSAEFADITVSDTPIVTAPSVTPAAVPEANTMFAGAAMLLPLGVGMLKKVKTLRKQRKA